MRDSVSSRRILLAAGVVAAATFMTTSPTAHAAPQGSCTTGSYVETTVGSDTVGTFAAPSNSASSVGCTWTVPAGVSSVRVLVVAGGGGGGGFHTAGGGGAGGLVHTVGFDVTPGANLSVTVGKGGAPGSAVGSQYTNPGGNGADSVFGSLTAVGGGGGGGGGANSQVGNPGSAGGSGGGGGRCWVSCNTSLVTSNGNKRLGGAATAGQGNRGGDALFMSGGGGGGAGAPGSASTGGAAGAGGDGLTIDISGSAASYAGGGGGGTENTASRAAGGIGGGGLGGSTADPVGADGTPGTGGGGGGARWTGSNGGSGVVIIRWGSAPTAPDITLSSSSGYGVTNSSLSTPYTISNSGGAATSYAISPALPAGLSFDTSTGLISGTPTAVSAATDYTVTARRVDPNNGASSSDTAVFNFAVYSTVPTTTTTTTTTSTVATQVTTTTLVASSQGTVDPAATTPVVAPAGSTALPAAAATTSPARGVTAATVAATTTSTTPAPTTTSTTIPAPDAPDAAPGEAGATVDGEEINVDVERTNNALVVSAADVTATVYGMDAAGERVALDADGNLRLEEGDSVVVEASGYEPGSEVEIWLRSTPVQLGVRTADASGAVTGRFAVPSSVDPGDHRVILSGLTAAGGKSIIGVGLRIGAYEKEDGLNRWLIIVPLVLATMLALVIPTTARRRKRANG